MRQPSLESLRVVEACVRHASFARAAAELAVTPAAVSMRIRDLERDLGVALFDRHGPRVVPTPAVERLAAALAGAFGEIRAAVDLCRAAAPIRLSAAPTIAARWLSRRIARYDAVPVDVAASDRLSLPSEVDIAIRTGTGGWPGFDVVPLMPVALTALLAPALARELRNERPAALARLPLLAHPAWPAWFRAAGVPEVSLRYAAIRYATYDLDASAAITGEGAALLQPAFFADEVAAGRLVQPFDTVLETADRHHVLTAVGEARPAVLALREWLIAEAVSDS